MIKLEVHNNHLLEEPEGSVKKIYSTSLEDFKVRMGKEMQEAVVSKTFLMICLEVVSKEKEEHQKDLVNQV